MLSNYSCELDAKLLAGDPILKIITKKNPSPVLFGIAFSLIYNLLRLAAALFAGHGFTQGTVVGFFEDPGMYVNFATGSAIWAYYAWMPRGVASVVIGLAQNGTIGEASGKLIFEDFKTELASWLGAKKVFIFSLSLSVIIILVFVLPGYLHRYQTQDSWSMADPINVILSTGWTMLGLYVIFLLLMYCAMSIIWLRRLFLNFHVNVRPLHPDGAGGLSPLGKFSLTLSYIITLVGILLVSTPILRNYLATKTLEYNFTTDTIMGLVAYVILAPLVFFFPLSVAHSAMVEAKGQLLLTIAQRFDTEHEKVKKALNQENISIKKELNSIKELQSLHEMVIKFPVWPFNTASITRFATSFISPILLAVLTDLAGRLFNP